jgi:cyclopropane-fatty-acyl-phospholipid synthase
MSVSMPSGVGAAGVAEHDAERSVASTAALRASVDKPGRRVTALDRWVAARVQQFLAPAGIRVVLWDGSAPGGPAEFHDELVVSDRAALIGIAVNPDLFFGDAYMEGRADIKGSLERATEALMRAYPPKQSWLTRAQAALAFPNTLRTARRNVHEHYDLGNDFYRLWLDRDLVYTCAYFERPDVTLEEAQFAKLDLVCRKLRLQPGERVVEAGCGWGALALHMAKHYGAQVQAFNVSREQIAYARERAAAEGLSDRVEFIEDDYRSVSGEFDAFVSVGMLEHVGLRDFDSLAGVLRNVLKRRGGRGLLHFIGRDVPRPLNAWIRKRIFPGAYPPTVAEVATQVLAPAEMSIVDVENLRLHYSRTLEHWGQRFAAAHEQVRATFGEEFRRAWRLYLAGSRAAFETGWLQLFQVVFTPVEAAPPHWTRASVHVGLKPDTTYDGSTCQGSPR